MRIAGAINQVADRKHAARSMFREQSSRRAQGKILAMNIAEDANLPGKRLRATHDVASLERNPRSFQFRSVSSAVISVRPRSIAVATSIRSARSP